MSTLNFNLRNVASDLMILLKKEAALQKISVNSLILQTIEKGLGISSKKNIYHDLDHLAGTWNSHDKEVFDANVKSFENIDKELW